MLCLPSIRNQDKPKLSAFNFTLLISKSIALAKNPVPLVSYFSNSSLSSNVTDTSSSSVGVLDLWHMTLGHPNIIALEKRFCLQNQKY